MLNRVWSDLLLKVGGQILLAILILLTITFGAEPFFPKRNIGAFIEHRATDKGNTAVKESAPTASNANVSKAPNVNASNTSKASNVSNALNASIVAATEKKNNP